MLKNFLRDYFTFTRRERNGIFVLLIIIVLQIVLIQLLPFLLKKEKSDFTAFDKEISEWRNSTINFNDSADTEDSLNTPPDLYAYEKLATTSSQVYFPFNPNTVTDAELEKLGMNRGQIKSIRKYLAKGGKYQSKEDFKKMYVISPEEYSKLEPYIQLPPAGNETNAGNTTTEKSIHLKKKEIIEMNTADSTTLLTLHGIGSYFTHRILEYRKKLGGFINLNQLFEIKNFPPLNELADSGYTVITLDASLVKKTNINLCDVNDLKPHPYFRWNLANAIVNYRKMHGIYSTLDELKKIHLVNDSVFAKIAPYLTVE